MKLRRIISLFKSIYNLLHYNSIAVNMFSEANHKNWGDDLNLHLLKLITKKHIYAANTSVIHRFFCFKNYSCIGSIIGLYENKKTEIWGSGFISKESSLKVYPAKIHLVRGELTRKKILEMGIDCPKLYGDPALLVSKYYNAEPKGKYKLGIIPHYVDLDLDYIKEFVSSKNDVVLIDIANYDRWTDVCDMIVSCDYIVSSSLHGLIAADSYQKPNLWIKFSDKIVGGRFKYLDYFSSVERKDNQPLLVTDIVKLNELYDELNNIHYNARIDFDTILNSCPFKKKN